MDKTRYPQKKGHLPTWLKLLVWAVIVGVVLSIIGVMTSSGIKNVVQSQLKLLREHRITQAYYDYTAKSFQENNSLDEFRKYISLYPVLSDNKDFRMETQDYKDGKGVVTGTLVSDQLDEMRAEFQLVKERNSWKILGIRLQKLDSSEEEDLVDAELTDTVRKQLKTLQKGDITDAYYGFVSKDFQNETPLAEFQEFVESNRVLTSFKKMEVKSHHVEDGLGYVSLLLSSDDAHYLLEYKLRKEDDEWKVWSLRVVLPAEVASEKVATDPESLKPPVKEMLEALLLDDLQKAYRNTAKEFQEATPFSSFENFVLSNPALSRRELADFKVALIENGVGKMQVNLHDDEGITVLEFKLGYDEGFWKIWGIQVIKSPERHEDLPAQNSGREAKRNPLAWANEQALTLKDSKSKEETASKDSDAPVNDIKKVIIGTEVDEKGLIKTHRIVIDTDTNLIFINVALEDAKKDSLLTLFLHHIDSGTSAPPLATKITQDGETVVSFSYAAPSEGWPPGNYIVKAVSSTGDEHLQKFQLREGEKEFYLD